MIGLVSSVNSSWGETGKSFYLEVYGETQPVINSHFAEVISPRSAGKGQDPSTSSVPTYGVYEYWWSLGFHRANSTKKPSRSLLPARLHSQAEIATGSDATTFGEPAALVGLYFPTKCNWRVIEIAATVKFLTPVKDQHELWRDISTNISKLSPLVSDAGSVASLIPGGAMASTVLSTVAKLQVGSVPATSLNWSVEKTTHVEIGHPWQGIEWLLPKNTFDVLGGRVSGSVGVTFIDAIVSESIGNIPPDPSPEMAMKARADIAVHGGTELLRVPRGDDPFLSLPITPQRTI